MSKKTLKNFFLLVRKKGLRFLATNLRGGGEVIGVEWVCFSDFFYDTTDLIISRRVEKNI